MKLKEIRTREDAEAVLKNPKLFNELERDNKQYFNYIANKFNNMYHHVDDLRQVALEAMYLKALPAYNPEQRKKDKKGISAFQTFAYRVIFNDVLRYVRDQNKYENNSVSIEKFIKNSDDGASHGGDYFENLFIKRTEYENFENYQLEKLSRTDVFSELSENEKIMYKHRVLEKKKTPHRKIAEMLGLNIHTYKLIFYTSFKPKMKNLGVKV